MQLLIINGSPKKNNSNTGVMIEGFRRHIHRMDHIDVVSLSKTDIEKVIEHIKGANHVIIAMPLYGYAMPAQVLHLLQCIYKVSDSLTGKSYGFIIQYGFVEAIHARPLENYLINYVNTIHGKYLGTIIKGGCDSLFDQMNSRRGRAILDGISKIGDVYDQQFVFDPELIKAYSLPESQDKKTNKHLMKCIVFFANKLYWKKKLHKNGVSEKASFAKPYT